MSDRWAIDTLYLFTPVQVLFRKDSKHPHQCRSSCWYHFGVSSSEFLVRETPYPTSLTPPLSPPSPPPPSFSSPLLQDHDTFFKDGLDKWRELNCTLDFVGFHRDISNISNSLAQLLHHKVRFKYLVHLLVCSVCVCCGVYSGTPLYIGTSHYLFSEGMPLPSSLRVFALYANSTPPY